jgi:dTDP-4-amino-4,6-dideoxygalactose transaminase
MDGLLPRDLWEYSLADLFEVTYRLLRSDDLSDRFTIKHLGKILAVRSGRAALRLALKVIKFRPGAKIGVPLFCCPIVFEAIIMSAAEPVFIDCDKDTFCLSPVDLEKKIGFLDGLIVVHMFGIPAELASISNIAKDIPIIEDCAQALGSKYGNQPLGTFGKIALFSFRSGKYISSGEGGAIFSTDPLIMEECAAILNKSPDYGLSSELWHLIQVAAKSFLRQRPLYGIIGHKLWSLRNNFVNSSGRENISLGKIFKSDLITIKKRLNYFEYVVWKQRQIAEIYQRELKLPEEMLCREKPGRYYNRLYFPVTFPSKGIRDKMANALKKNKIDSMKYLDNLIETARKHYGYRGGCPQSESLSERVLNLPCYYILQESQIEKIIRTVNKAWEKIS